MCCYFLLLPIEKVRRVDEVLPFVYLRCLKMERQGLDFGVRALIHVRRWLRFSLMIGTAFFHSVGRI